MSSLFVKKVTRHTVPTADSEKHTDSTIRWSLCHYRPERRQGRFLSAELIHAAPLSQYELECQESYIFRESDSQDNVNKKNALT